MLANVEFLPNKIENDAYLIEHNIIVLNEAQKHKKAQNLLSFGDVENAWKVLLS